MVVHRQFYASAIVMCPQDGCQTPVVFHNVYAAASELEAQHMCIDGLMTSLAAAKLPVGTLHSYTVMEVPSSVNDELVYGVSLLIAKDFDEATGNSSAINLSCGFVVCDSEDEAIQLSKEHLHENNAQRLVDENASIQSGRALAISPTMRVLQ